jgi:hypothetical protein
MQISTLSLRVRTGMAIAMSLVAAAVTRPAQTEPRQRRPLSPAAAMRRATALVVAGYLAFVAGCLGWLLGVTLGVFSIHGDARGLLPVVVGTAAMLVLCLASVLTATTTPQPPSNWAWLRRYCIVTFAAVGALAAASLIMWTLPVTRVALGEILGRSQY